MAIRVASLKAPEIAEQNALFAAKTPQDLLAWALSFFDRGVGLCCGFGLEGVALLDMLMKIDSQARVFTLDTGRLAGETYDLIERCVRKYGTRLELFFPQHEQVEAMVSAHGINLFYDSVDLRRRCCEVRKVIPLQRALQGFSAWITGLRKGQSGERSSISLIEVDNEHEGILKLNPLANWSEEEVWSYIRENHVPYNRLYDQGYASVGCAPCTRPTRPGEDLRAGRWWWEQDQVKECGLHGFSRDKNHPGANRNGASGKLPESKSFAPQPGKNGVR